MTEKDETELQLTGPDDGAHSAGESPTLVVIAHARPKALARLLGSLSRLRVPSSSELRLVISIDDAVPETVAVAKRFDWQYGQKRVIGRAQRMGLREHVLACGDLTLEYGSCVVLEDDLYVSPDAARYAQLAVAFYRSEPAIAGISLYSYRIDEYTGLSFMPMDDGHDTYFIQTPSSSGQIWTPEQWSSFRQWYSKVDDIQAYDLPTKAMGWPPGGSWKRYYLAYLIDTGRYFVFPHYSLTTNCGEPGTHFRQASVNVAAPIALEQSDWRLAPWRPEAVRYDAWFEPDPRTIARWWPQYGTPDVTMDFLGHKLPSQVRTPMLLSSRQCSSFDEGFPMILLPSPLNLDLAGEGRFFCLGRTEDFGELPPPKRRRMIEILNGDINRDVAAGVLFDRVARRARRDRSDPREG